MTSVNIIVYDFGVRGFTSSRDIQVAMNVNVNVVLTFALCDQNGTLINLSQPSAADAIKYFQLTDYYSGSSSIADFAIQDPTIAKTAYNSFTVEWKVTCKISNARQTFGYIIDTQNWALQGSGQAYNLSMKGAQNAFSLHSGQS
ncbi:hypothetical protein [Brucella sp. LJL56]